jgi:iron complex outermembrane receptor protein
MSNSRVAGAVRMALVAASAASAGLVTNQTALAQDAEMEQIVVTGSRIRVRDFEEVSPVSTVGSDVIASIGATSVDQVLNTLPQVVPGFTATSNNPSDGTATVDLRGLGPERTLVLINGRRLTPSTQTGRTDLNNVPTQLIERVEVVTGGASAVYGSDALAGVVNFILKDDFEGFEAGYQYGVSDRGDGGEHTADITLGGNFADGAGNFTGFVSYNQRDSILQGDRSYTKVDYGFYHILGLQPNFAGSVTGLAGRFDNNAATNPFGSWSGNATGTGGNWVQQADGVTRRHVSLLPEYNNGVGDRYNFAPVNLLLTPAEKWTLGALGHYEFNEHARTYMELLYVNSKNSTQLAPTPATNVQVAATSPFLSDASRELAASRPNPDGPLTFRRRMAEVGPRQQENDSSLFQVVTGVGGSIGFKDWEYDAYYLYGQNEFDNYTYNDVSTSKFEAGIAGCPADYATFVPNCVPVNPFGIGTMTPEMTDFIRLNFADQQIFKRHNLAAVLNGTLVDLPAGALGFAVGAEYRKDSTDYRPDIAKQQGDILGFNAQQPIRGDFDVTELYFEAAVPLVKDVVGFQDLSLELGYRYSDYSSVGGVEAYKGGLNWAVTDGIRVRGMYQRAVRAPSVFELYQAGDQGFPSYTDPCAGLEQADDPDTYAFCQAQGLPAPENYVQPNSQVEAFFFGSPDLSEETSDTYTLGLVWTPSFIDGFNASFDYYDIKVDDYVTTLNGGVTGIIDACFASLDLNSPDCYFDPINAPLVYRIGTGEMQVNAPQVNASKLQTKGVDIQLNYNIPVWNTIRLSLLATYLDSWVLDGIDYKGSTGAYNISGSFPEWKANMRVAVPIGPVTLNWNLTWIDSMINQGDLDKGQAFGEGNCNPDGDSYKPCFGTVGSKVYNDVSAMWQLNDTWSISAGVNNLFNEEPELVQLGIDMNTDPGTYDVIGTYYFGTIRAKF